MKTSILKTQLTILLLAICTMSIAQWSAVTPVNPMLRDRGAHFVINDTAYVGAGTNTSTYFHDFEKYSVGSNTWDHIADLPSGRGGDLPFSFVIGNTAYVGMGTDPSAHNSFAKYVPGSGWIALPDFPFAGRGFSVGFSIGGKGYMGAGYNGTTLNDFYEYDPTGAGTWTQKANIPGPTNGGGVAFSTGGKGYIGLGGNGNGMYEYDPISDTWKTMAPFPYTNGTEEFAYFELCGKLIVTSGTASNNQTTSNSQETWMFDPTDGSIGKWSRLPDFIGTADYSPTGFSLGNAGYVVGGQLITTTNTMVNQMWKYTPTLSSATSLTSGSSDVTICKGQSTILTATGSSIYKWSPSISLSDSITGSSTIPGAKTQTTASPTSTTTYTVTEGVCGQIMTVKVTVDIPPVADAGIDKNICSGKSTQIGTPSVAGNKYIWSNGLDSVAMPMVSPTDSTTYVLTIVDANGCSGNPDSVLVVINPSPTAAFTVTPDICAPLFTNTSTGAASYSWNFGDGVSSTESSPTHSYINAGTYNSSLTAISAEGCTDTANEEVIIVEPLSTLYVPNAFTPNGDGLNDLFIVGSSSLLNFEATIFNRWGEKITSWSDVKGSWDGTQNGKAVPEGTYVCIVKAKSICGEETYEKREMVTVVR